MVGYLVKVVFLVQVDAHVTRVFLEVELHCHWHYLTSIRVETLLQWCGVSDTEYYTRVHLRTGYE